MKLGVWIPIFLLMWATVVLAAPTPLPLAGFSVLTAKNTVLGFDSLTALTLAEPSVAWNLPLDLSHPTGIAVGSSGVGGFVVTDFSGIGSVVDPTRITLQFSTNEYVMSAGFVPGKSRVFAVSGGLDFHKHATGQLLWQSDDAGRSWTNTFIIPNSSEDIGPSHIHFGSSYGLLAAGKSIYRTFDDGASWRGSEINATSESWFLMGVAVLNDTHAVVLMTTSLFISADSGATWTGIPTQPPVTRNTWHRSLAVVSSSTWIVAGGESILRTEDAGASWTVVYKDQSLTWYHVAYSTEWDTVLAAGVSSDRPHPTYTILACADAGGALGHWNTSLLRVGVNPGWGPAIAAALPSAPRVPLPSALPSRNPTPALLIINE